MMGVFNLISKSEVKAITSDSKLVVPGTLFFAVKGAQHDGHDFVRDALEKGAVSAVIEYGHKLEQSFNDEPRVIRVQNTRKALAESAAEFYGLPSNRMIVCGVTGTNGKTTTSYLIEALLKTWGRKTTVIGTIASALTTPDPVTLQRTLSEALDQGTDAVAMEVSSHALDQHRVAGMQFSAVIFTNLTQDHLDYHASMEDYFAAKAKLFLEYPVRVRVVNRDDSWGKKLIGLCAGKGLPVVTFGKSGADVNYGALHLSQDGLVGEIEFHGEKLRIQMPLLGEFNAQNVAGVVAAGLGLGIPDEAMLEALNNFTGVPGRMELIPNEKRITVAVDYSHTPDSLEKALSSLRALLPKTDNRSAKLLVVFGCGGDRDKTKRPLMGEIAERLADFVVLTSDNPRTESPSSILDDVQKGFKNPKAATLFVEPDRERAIAKAISTALTGDIVLIAGKGHETYQIVGTRKLAFDDREIARKYLEL